LLIAFRNRLTVVDGKIVHETPSWSG